MVHPLFASMSNTTLLAVSLLSQAPPRMVNLSLFFTARPLTPRVAEQLADTAMLT